jgi:hypothetical protein
MGSNHTGEFGARQSPPRAGGNLVISRVLSRPTPSLRAFTLARWLVTLALLPGCGGRTDLDGWQDFYDGTNQASGGGSGDAVGGGFGVGGMGVGGTGTGGTFSTGGASSTGGAFSTGGAGAGGSTGGSGGGSGGVGGSGGADGSGGSTSVSGNVFVDCETTIEGGDGFSWASPLKHPALAILGRVDGDVVYLKAGTCHAQSSASDPLLTIPGNLKVTLAGGYDGDNLNDPLAHSGGRTVLSGDNDENDEGLPAAASGDPNFAESRADNNKQILSIGAGADVLVTNLEIRGAYAPADDDQRLGCVSVGEDAKLSAVSTTVRNCSTVSSAALHAAPGSTVELSGVLFEYNESSGGAGVLYAQSSRVVLRDGAHFSDNRAARGGAVALLGSDLEVTGGAFLSNAAYHEGGAIYLEDAGSSASIQTSYFNLNQASLGGAIASSEGSLSIGTSLFRSNAAAGYGGSIHTVGGTFTLMETRFEGGQAAAGGELNFVEPTGVLIDSCSFWNSTAQTGGIISVSGGEDFLIASSRFYGGSAQQGGQIMASGAPLSIQNSLFWGGTATRGGALYVSGGELTSTTSTFVRASATSDGSSIVAQNAALQLDTSTFVENVSEAAPVIGVSGTSSGFISRSVFRDNIGEGALSIASASIYFADSYIGTHSSMASGALTLDSGANVTTRGLTLAENTTNGASTPALSVRGASRLALQNAVIWGSASAPDALFSVEDGASVTVTTSCGPAALSNFGSSTTVSSSPFSNLSPQFPLFQAPTSPCGDQGSDANQDYSAVSVVTPFSADTGAVDPGYHYAEFTPATGTLTATESEVVWDIDVDWCVLHIPSEGLEIGAGPSSSYEDSFQSGTDFLLLCTVNGDAPPLVLTATN